MLGYLFGGNGLMGILLIAGLAIARGHGGARADGAPAPGTTHAAGAVRRHARNGRRAGAARAPAARGASRAAIPAGFDASGLPARGEDELPQAAGGNDAGRLDEIREFTTDELYEELRKDFGRSARPETDIAALDADLLEFATEGNRHWASVRFSGTVREAPGAEPEAFTEVWNLVKPADGSSGWLLAGIQQMH